MDADTKARVRDRAGNRCEYGRIHQQHYIITFHVEHIVAQQHHRGNDESNLAGMDSTTGELTRLFSPRTDTSNQHFRIQAGRVVGLTPVGRTTANVLNMNRPDRVRIRIELEPETFLG